MLDYALYYGSRSWRVTPLHSPTAQGGCTCGKPNCPGPGKHPRLPGWQKGATTETAVITSLWQKHPDSNIGVATGAGSGLFVLDVDAKKGGLETLAALEKEYGPLPHTLRVSTGGGGKHFYFKYPEGLKIKNKTDLRPGLDIRGDGGQVAAPPSLHSSGRKYEWDQDANPGNTGLVEPPTWLLRLITNEGAPIQKPFELPEQIDEGGRNDNLFRYGCSLRAKGKGMNRDEIHTALLIVNDSRCSPPVDQAELKQIVDSVMAYSPGPTAKEDFSDPHADLNAMLKGTSYKVKGGAIGFIKDTREGRIFNRLCNFTAWQKEKKTLDDGAELKHSFIMGGKTSDGRILPDISIPASQFSSLSWIHPHWSPAAIMAGGTNAKDRLREAIEWLSQYLIRRYVYGHTGWRNINGQWVFLHAGGAVGATDSIEVDLPRGLNLYHLPDSVGNIQEAVAASIGLLGIGKPEITFPLWSAIYRAPLAELYFPDLTLFLWGPSGLFKSTTTALFLNHFGRFFTDNNLPAGWTSTGNSLEKLAFQAKDLPLVIDDYAPERDPQQMRKLEGKANQMLRNQGNQTGRGRMAADGSLRTTYTPRGLQIGTGEQLPDSIQSIAARYLSVKFEPGSIDRDKLTAAQAPANVGLYGQAMRGYIEWLIPQMDTLRESLPLLFKTYREGARVQGHARLSEAVAHLFIGADLGLDYACGVGAITEAQKRELRKQAWITLISLANEHGQVIQQERPSKLFLQALETLFTQKKIHLEEKELRGMILEDADRWGVPKYGETPSSIMVGWVDDNYIYLLPEASFKEVASFYRESGSGFPVKEKALREYLRQEGVTEVDQGRTSKLERINGIRPHVLKIHKENMQRGI